jgi:hypothetical protein
VAGQRPPLEAGPRADLSSRVFFAVVLLAAACKSEPPPVPRPQVPGISSAVVPAAGALETAPARTSTAADADPPELAPGAPLSGQPQGPAPTAAQGPSEQPAAAAPGSSERNDAAAAQHGPRTEVYGPAAALPEAGFSPARTRPAKATAAREEAADAGARSGRPVELRAESALPQARPGSASDGGARAQEPLAAGGEPSSVESAGGIYPRLADPEPESPARRSGLDIPGAQSQLETARVRRFVDSGGATLDGRVIDVDTGRGIAGAEIEAWMGTRSVEVESDREGRFRLEGLVADSRIMLWITASPTFIQERTEVSVPPDRPGFEGTFTMLSRAAVAGSADGGAGMFLGRRGSRTLVTGLAAFGPAEKAGVSVGDTIVAVAERKVGDLGPGAIDYLLRGPIGSVVHVMVQTGSQPPRRIVLVRSAR